MVLQQLLLSGVQMEQKTLRYIKLLWFPALALLMIVFENYTGVLQSAYAIPYTIVQIALFAAYVIILFMSRKTLVPDKSKVKGMRNKKN
jgi:hypothetical protein